MKNMLPYLWKSAQGAAFALVMLAVSDATKADVILAFMVGVSFDPRHFWWFL